MLLVSMNRRFVVVGVLLLGILVSLCLVLIIAVTWSAITADVRGGFTYEQWGTLKDEAERLDCYDKVYRLILTKGTRPPLSYFSTDQLMNCLEPCLGPPRTGLRAALLSSDFG